jgi:tryptophan 2,3-dioxygenase
VSDLSISRRINQLPVRDLVRTQWEHGRRALPEGFAAPWQRAHTRAVRILADNDRAPAVRRLAGLLREVTFSLHRLSRPERVSYYSYTDVGVIDWYLAPYHAPFDQLKRRAMRGALVLFNEHRRFESANLDSGPTGQRLEFDRDVVQSRLAIVNETVRDCVRGLREVGFDGLDEPYQGQPFDTFEEYVSELGRLRVLVDLTCFPQTRYHDEVCFLRTIHISELCFFALRMVVSEATENLRRGYLPAAAHALEQGTAITAFLFNVFLVLWTMPVEHFIRFRDYTESGSAVQSRNYQLLDIHLRGVDGRKLRIYRLNPPLSDLRLFRHHSFVSLRSVLNDPELRASPDWPRVERAADAFDQALLKWRGRHAAFARRYLEQPKSEAGALPATGGTAGYPYLKQFIQEGIRTHPAEVAEAVEQTSLLDLDRALAGEWVDAGPIAPPQDRRPLGPRPGTDSWSVPVDPPHAGPSTPPPGEYPEPRDDPPRE